MSADMPKLSKSQKAALVWLFEHNGDGGFGVTNFGGLIAGGEVGPFMRSTWNGLRNVHLVEYYDKRRVRLTPMARATVEGWKAAGHV